MRKKENGRVTVKEAADLMGTSQQFVRLGLQRQQLPIGAAVKLSSKWTYYISPELFKQYTGIDVKEEKQL